VPTFKRDLEPTSLLQSEYLTFLVTIRLLRLFLCNHLNLPKTKKKQLSALFLEVSGACAVAIYFSSSPLAIVTVSTVFLATVNAGLSVHNTVAINLFPTSMRYEKLIS